MFVLTVGKRTCLNISAMISNLLRFDSNIFSVLNIVYYLSGKSKPFPRQALMQKSLGHAFPAVYILSMPYKDERTKAAFSSSLLLLSTTSSPRLMTLLLVNHFSSGFASLTHVPSPPSQLLTPNKFSGATLLSYSKRYINPQFFLKN